MFIKDKIFKEIVWRILGREKVGELKYALNFVISTLKRVFLKRKKINLYQSCKITVYKSKKKYGQIFFGYHDLNPINRRRNKILAHELPFSTNSKNNGKEVSVGYFDLGSPSEYIEFGKTNAWSWQMGARLRWLDESRVIYNSIVNGKYGSVIYDVDLKSNSESIEVALYDISVCGKKGLSLDFSRLQTYRPGYGYSCDIIENNLLNGGVYSYCFESKALKEIISLERLSKFECDFPPNDLQYINHLKFNKDGDRFCFFHISVCSMSGKRFTRLITSDFYGEKLFTLINKGTPSHFCWISNTELLVTVSNNGSVGYYKYIDLNRKYDKIEFHYGNLDGHPMYSQEDGIFVSDTYPNSLREQVLYSIDDKNYSVLKKCSFYTPYKFKGEVRCDLHPRIDSGLVVVDCATNNKRELITVEWL
ncbi:hypothetical protein [Marinomonas sp. PE14-40]|uniref:hypothetical protein n=1 Tax=Marinomonas sp. PE14-40 TaxID=3060621 RepID=UPI003F66FE8E